jgi:hypothetical protein
MAIANTKVFGNHLDGDINYMFFDEYMEYPMEHDKIAKFMYKTGNGQGDHYREGALSPLGDAATIPQGNPVTFSDPVEGNVKRSDYVKYGLGFQITEEMMEDDLQGNFRGMPQKLAKAMKYKQDFEFFYLFNQAFSSTNKTAWDENAICVSSGRTTLKSGDTQNNAPSTGAALSETSLRAAFEYFDSLVDESGNPVYMRPKYLVVPTAERWTARNLYYANGKVTSADNDINTVNPAYMPEEWAPFISRWLTDSDNWFLLAEEHDARFIWRTPVRLQSSDDFLTGNALFKSTMRFVTDVYDPKGIYGSNP